MGVCQELSRTDIRLQGQHKFNRLHPISTSCTLKGIARLDTGQPYELAGIYETARWKDPSCYRHAIARFKGD